MRAHPAYLPVFAAAIVIIGSIFPAHGQQSSQEALWKEAKSLAWQGYPAVGQIGDVAKIRTIGDVRFLDSENTNRFVQINGNPPVTNAYTIAPPSMMWFALFAFDPIGYVHDDETIDPDALLKTLQEQNERSIEHRKKLGLEILHLTGWFVTPHYDVRTKQLEWGTRLVGENGGVTVNYTIRMLGRSGVVRAVLVSEPNRLEQDIKDFRVALRGFEFLPGQSYSEFRSGDKVAGYGLAALIVGGAAAAAAKTGAGKALIKFIWIGALAVFAVIGRFFRGIKAMFSGRRNY